MEDNFEIKIRGNGTLPNLIKSLDALIVDLKKEYSLGQVNSEGFNYEDVDIFCEIY